jgi:hypothetical protein
MKHSNTILKRVVKQIASGFSSFLVLSMLWSSDALSELFRDEISFIVGRRAKAAAVRRETRNSHRKRSHKSPRGKDNQINHTKGYKTMKSVSTCFVLSSFMKFKYATWGWRGWWRNVRSALFANALIRVAKSHKFSFFNASLVTIIIPS